MKKKGNPERLSKKKKIKIKKPATCEVGETLPTFPTETELLQSQDCGFQLPQA